MGCETMFWDDADGLHGGMEQYYLENMDDRVTSGRKVE